MCFSADILQRLSTEAELQDLYSTMNIDGVALPAPLSTTDGLHLNDPAPEDAGLDEAIEEMAVGIVDTFDEAIQEMVPRTPLGKHKERSAQQSSVLLRERCAMLNGKRRQMWFIMIMLKRKRSLVLVKAKLGKTEKFPPATG